MGSIVGSPLTDRLTIVMITQWTSRV